MREIELGAEAKSRRGRKKELSGLRAGHRVPAVVYGESRPPLGVSVDERALLDARKTGGLNAVIHLKVQGGEVETVILKSMQRHPVSDRPIHADFQRISLARKIEAKVPLHIVGEAPGVKNSGGLLQHELRFLSVRALPTQIPQAIEVDVSSLNLNERLSVKDLRVPQDIEVLDAPDHMIVHVGMVKEVVAEAAPVPAETVVAPESSSTKGKKDEEGKLVKDAKVPAAAAPAAEKGKEPAKK